ncbi:unnamed protein product [Polarella glacialis]|uniref:BTB domain-containing protein n=1 Tax=Polarella glacialis TaxID=89957 RepID=A0A813L7J2_POLGL|nr:unnamed protein product [Polarella glacialis]CAE8721222.1 unnamed protein product [Polarella glacialis]
MADASDAAAVQPDVEVLVEGEVFQAHSQVLMIASPVFAAMLTSGMQEGQTQKIDLVGKKAAEFSVFLKIVYPCRGRLVDAGNVDFLLEWFEEYQLGSNMKEECEEQLLKMTCSFPRLLQAFKFGLKAQYKRCLEDTAQRFTELSTKELLHVGTSQPMTQELLPLVKKAVLAERALANKGTAFNPPVGPQGGRHWVPPAGPW